MQRSGGSRILKAGGRAEEGPVVISMYYYFKKDED